MKHYGLVAVIGLAAFGAACDSTTAPAVVGTTSANVRFVNAVQGSNVLLLTSNGTALGAPVTSGAGAPLCAPISTASGSSLAFGVPNAAGTSLTTTLGTRSGGFVQGGNYTVIAVGTATAPTLLVLDNAPATAATAGNANVRVVNATSAPVDVFATQGTTLGTATFAAIGANGSSSFVTIPTASNTLTFRAAGSSTTLFTTPGTFQSTQDYTIVLMPSPSGTSFQTVVVRDC